MDDYEAPAMRFALDNEFEGGEFGQDGEFYAYGQKVKFWSSLGRCVLVLPRLHPRNRFSW